MTHVSIRRVSGDNSEMKELAARICRDYLSGAWKQVTAQNIGFKHISGGLSNLLYHISLPDTGPAAIAVDDSVSNKSTHDNGKQDPKEVLIRVYGQTHGERGLEVLITESVIFTLLSERGLGPKLHGVFPGGRIEQYIKARPLSTKELADEGLSVQIAHKMAAIHSMEVPLHKNPGWLWDTINRWLKSCDKRLATVADVPEKVRGITKIDLRAEADWLRQRVLCENNPVVFCHNDMQEGNILLQQQGDDDEQKLVLIDFEYCSYNYRAFDIANHFAEWQYDYTEKCAPFFRHTGNYPSESQQVRFVRAYLDEMGSKESVQAVLDEVKVFTLVSHFFWALWAVVNTQSQITFGYWDYALARLNGYFEQKALLCEACLQGGVKRKLSDAK